MIVAFFVVKWLLRFVVSHTFNGFAIYRVILGAGLLIGLYTNAIPDVSNDAKAEKKEPPVLTAPGHQQLPGCARQPRLETLPPVVTPLSPATDAGTDTAAVTPATTNIASGDAGHDHRPGAVN